MESASAQRRSSASLRSGAAIVFRRSAASRPLAISRNRSGGTMNSSPSSMRSGSASAAVDAWLGGTQANAMEAFKTKAVPFGVLPLSGTYVVCGKSRLVSTALRNGLAQLAKTLYGCAHFLMRRPARRQDPGDGFVVLGNDHFLTSRHSVEWRLGDGVVGFSLARNSVDEAPPTHTKTTGLTTWILGPTAVRGRLYQTFRGPGSGVRSASVPPLNCTDITPAHDVEPNACATACFDCGTSSIRRASCRPVGPCFRSM